MECSKRIGKIIRENALEQTKRKRGREFDTGLVLSGLGTTWPTWREERSGDQNKNSPCDVNALQNKWVTRIRDMIAQDEYAWLIP